MSVVAGSGQMAVAARAKAPPEITAAHANIVRALQRAVDRAKPDSEPIMNYKKGLPAQVGQVRGWGMEWPNGLGM